MADDAALADYRAEPYSSSLSALASAQSPDLVLFPTTARTRELAGMVAVDLNTGVLTDISGLESNGDQLVATRPIYEGKVLEKAVCSGKPVLVTIRGRAFPKPEPDASRTGMPVKVEVKAEALTSVEGYSASESAVNRDAGVIVSGGRGVSNNSSLTPPAGLDEKQAEIWRAQQGFNMIGELAGVLGAAVGASRAAVVCSPLTRSSTDRRALRNNTGILAVPAQCGDQTQAVQTREHDVVDRRIIGRPPGQLQPVEPVVGVVDDEAFVPKPVGDEVGDGVVVLDDQESHVDYRRCPRARCPERRGARGHRREARESAVGVSPQRIG